MLANPAGTGGGRYGLATLNRQQFADLGSFAALWIDLPPPPPRSPTPIPRRF